MPLYIPHRLTEEKMMSKEPVVVIFREGNDVNVCGIPLSVYPTGKIPEVGDKIPLHAEKTFSGSRRVGGKTESVTIKYFDNELATVEEVWAGNGDLLHPNNECPFYSFSEDLEGYGIRVGWEGGKVPQGMQPLHADVIFGL